MNKVLGIIGGVGPLATAYFLERIICFTKAEIDQEHIDSIVLNHCSIPDRTAYILDNSVENPIPYLLDDIKKLENLQVDIIVTPCNTAHYFYNEMQESTKIPIVNMICETVEELKNKKAKKVGIMATKGTVLTNLYQNQLRKFNLEYALLDDFHQQIITDVIFSMVKANKEVDINLFNKATEYFINLNCDKIILGCTELSIVNRDYKLNENIFVDSLDVLAKKSILMCDKKIIN